MGSGGVGGYFGAKFQRAGERVTLVARGAHLEAITRAGLAIRSAGEGDTTVRPAAVERLEGVDRADAVLFCVKSFDTDDAAARLKSVLGPDTAVLSLQNGVDNEDRIDAALGAGRAMGGVAQVFATIEAPGVIRHHAAGRIILGELDGRVSARAERLRDAFAHAEIPARAVRDHPPRALGEIPADLRGRRHDRRDARDDRGRPRHAGRPGACSGRSSRRSRLSRAPPASTSRTTRSSRS